ncbi:MAG: hypothetical protein ACRD96_00395, partial [Bryobacteraceae bacterium]
MTCLHCGSKISLLRRLSDRRFCSEEHRAAHAHEMSDLGLERLLHAPPPPSRPPEMPRSMKPPSPRLPTVTRKDSSPGLATRLLLAPEVFGTQTEPLWA